MKSSEVLPKEFSKATRSLIYSRCRGYCEKCGLAMSEEEMIPHHRQLKSQGGKGIVQNGIGVHDRCHVASHKNSIHANPEKAYEMGWLVQSWQDPSECPLILPDGRSVKLTAQGDYALIG